jgi:DNA mismatch repair protein MutS
MTIQQSIPVPSDATQPAEAPARVTPMMEQYLEIKAANPGLLLFYRMGDFYELFFEDAEIASKALGIMLTKRGKHQGMDIPMCGVPVERSDDYLHRLIAQGHRVAVCEQMEDAGARQQERGPPRRGPAGDAGHADRRHPAGREGQQLSAGDRTRARIRRRRPHRAGLDRHFHLGIHRHGMLDRRTGGDAVADQSQ